MIPLASIPLCSRKRSSSMAINAFLRLVGISSMVTYILLAPDATNVSTAIPLQSYTVVLYCDGVTSLRVISGAVLMIPLIAPATRHTNMIEAETIRVMKPLKIYTPVLVEILRFPEDSCPCIFLIFLLLKFIRNPPLIIKNSIPK